MTPFWWLLIGVIVGFVMGFGSLAYLAQCVRESEVRNPADWER